MGWMGVKMKNYLLMLIKMWRVKSNVGVETNLGVESNVGDEPDDEGSNEWPIVGLDGGCFLKGIYGGQLLAAIGLDGNDNMFPIAIAVVEAECKDSWIWFLTQLIEDIGDGTDISWTFILDRQKGLVHTLKQVLPNFEYRYCLRHFYTNFRQKLKGKELRELIKETYLRTYSFMIKPVPGEHDWIQTRYEAIAPSYYRKSAGRPRKERKKVANEPKNPHKARGVHDEFPFR
ncbi:hypothetical protein ACSBR1_002168 [Camellia fascicularis]